MSKLETRKTEKIVTHSVDIHTHIYTHIYICTHLQFFLFFFFKLCDNIYIYIYICTHIQFLFFFSSSYVTIQILKLDKTDFVTHLSCECNSCTIGVLRVYLSTSSKRILTDSEWRPLIFHCIFGKWIKSCQVEIRDATTFVR